jgi:hypothetical protein
MMYINAEAALRSESRPKYIYYNLKDGRVDTDAPAGPVLTGTGPFGSPWMELSIDQLWNLVKGKGFNGKY